MGIHAILQAKDGPALGVSGLVHTGPIGGGYPNVVSWDPNVADKLYYGADIGGMGYSEDGGKTVVASAFGLGFQDSHAKIATINAFDIGGSTTVVAGTGFKGTGGEVVSSTDGALSWTVDSTDISFSAQNSDSPLPTGRPRSTDPTLILRLPSGNWVAGTYDAGVWLSTDNRANWTDLSLFTGAVHIRSMALDPDDANAIYVGLWGDSGSLPNKGLWHVTNLNGSPSATKVSGIPDVVESMVALGDRLYVACGTYGVRRYAPNAGGGSGGYSYDGGAGGTSGVVNEPHVGDLDGFRNLELDVELSKADWTVDSEVIRQWDPGDANQQSIRLRITGGGLQWRIRAADGSFFSYDITGWTPPTNGATATLRIENRSDGTGEFFQNSTSVDTWSHDIDSTGQASSTTTQGLEIGTSGDTVYSAAIVTDQSSGGGAVITDITGSIGASKMSTAIDGVAGASSANDMLVVGTAEGLGQIWHSTNGGSSWVNTTASGININPWGSTQPVMAFDEHPNWALNEAQCDVAGVAISPDDSDKWVACSTSAIWTTDDAGATWRPANGYQIMSYRDGAVSPTGAIAVGNVDHDVVYSTDNGASWDKFGVGGVTVTHGLTWSPDGTELAYANNERDNNNSGAECYVTSTLGSTGTNTGWNSTSAGSGGKRVVGLGWTTLSGGADRLIAAVDNGGVWTIDRSGSWGSWVQRSTALMGSQSNNALRCSADVAGQYAFIYDRANGVWRSTDYGATWTQLWANSVPGGDNVGYVAYDQSGDVLYVAADNGLYRFDTASSASSGSQTNLGFSYSPGAIAFDAGRLWVVSLPSGAGNPGVGLYYSDNPSAGSPTFSQQSDATLQRVSPEITDISVVGGKVVMTTQGKGLFVGSSFKPA